MIIFSQASFFVDVMIFGHAKAKLPCNALSANVHVSVISPGLSLPAEGREEA